MNDTRIPEPDPAADDAAAETPAPERTDPLDPAAAAAAEPSPDAVAAGAEPVADAEEPAAPSPAEILAAERDAFHEKWLRAAAEMDNVRKRARRDAADARRFAQADLLRPLLAVGDDLERALGSMADDGDATVESVREGVALIQQRFRAVLKDHGVAVVEARDVAFDPACHEAVGQVEREGVEAGFVVEIVQQGYRLGELLLRPARVIISS